MSLTKYLGCCPCHEKNYNVTRTVDGNIYQKDTCMHDARGTASLMDKGEAVIISRDGYRIIFLQLCYNEVCNFCNIVNYTFSSIVTGKSGKAFAGTLCFDCALLLGRTE